MPSVLVAEDEPLVRLSLLESLRMQKYEVYGARDGETAIQFMDRKDFDAVITDYRMPGTVNGLEVLRHFHTRHSGRVKVLITGYGTAETESAVKAMGGVFVRKPFMIEHLIETLDKLLTH
ncbi:MAG TPA: response regulator [Candidatus Eisenbacteria bacterium]|nr:response regulator [Candidatus Eisenbacteria bacterium]